MATTGKEVRAFTAKTLLRLLNAADPAAQRAALANLRRGIGHTPGELPQLWGEFLQEMPEEMYGRYGQPSRAEWAVYTALTLFALHQQGRDPAKEPMHCEGKSLGAAAAQLALEEDRTTSNQDGMKRILKRLNAAATANSVAALAYYLRGLVQLLRAESVPLDYVMLAGDVYAYQSPDSVNAVRLRWGQDFYGTYYKNRKGEEEGNEEE